jgi:hypothetical protein
MATLTIEVFEADGQVDVETTLRFAREIIEAHALDKGAMDEGIGAAVSAVLDSSPGKPLAFEAIKGFVLGSHGLNTPPHAYVKMGERVKAYVQANTGKTRAEGRLFRTTKGPGGGTMRWSEYVDKV